jgi:hypothetical protein
VFVSISFLLAEPVPAPLPAGLATASAPHLVQTPIERPLALRVDGGALPSQRTLDTCCLVSPLLVLHQSGARIRLRHASPVLRRGLQQMKANSLFTLAN